MSAPARPFVDLTIGGSPAGAFVGKALKEFTYRDVHHGQVDDITIKLSDEKGLWRSSWGIDEGTEVSALMGYRDLLGGVIHCGTYAVDEVEIQGDSNGDIAVFKCLAAFTSQDHRTDRAEAFDEMSLQNIVGKVASRSGLQVVGDIPNLNFERITQNRQSDLGFLTRLAEDWGCYFSVKGRQLVFTSRESIEQVPPARSFDLGDGSPIKSYKLRGSTRKLYTRAEASFFHPRLKKIVKSVMDDARVLSGDVLKIDARAETQAHSERMAQAKLAKANDELGTGSITVPGDPLLVAGQVISLGSTFGRYQGRWLVTQGTHRYSAAGYTTTIDVKMI